jgi:hypothetical protein
MPPGAAVPSGVCAAGPWVAGDRWVKGPRGFGARPDLNPEQRARPKRDVARQQKTGPHRPLGAPGAGAQKQPPCGAEGSALVELRLRSPAGRPSAFKSRCSSRECSTRRRRGPGSAPRRRAGHGAGVDPSPRVQQASACSQASPPLSRRGLRPSGARSHRWTRSLALLRKRVPARVAPGRAVFVRTQAGRRAATAPREPRASRARWGPSWPRARRGRLRPG